MVGSTWRDGVFAHGASYAGNRLGYEALYYWLNGRGDTVRVRGRPSLQVDHLVQHAATRDGRYYLAGAGDGSGTGQTPLALHYSLVCLDTAGNFRWQRQYQNPTIRVGPSFPAFVGGYAYLRRIVEAPRRGWLLLGDTQRDSANFQLYAIEVDSGGQPRRTRWIEPFGRAATLHMYFPASAVRLRDGSGYVLSGQAQIDSLGRTRTHGFVARLDTALRVVWRTLLEAPPLSSVTPFYTTRATGAVHEAANGSLRVLTYLTVPRGAAGEFDILHLSAQGQLTRRDTYCSQMCATALVRSWELLPGDTAVVVCGTCQQRDATGRLLTQPAWVARFELPCRRQVLAAGRAAPVTVGAAAAYPQPAAPGGAVRLALARPLRGAVRVQLLDALGRALEVPATADGAGELELRLPATLAPGLYAVRVSAGGVPAATAKLLVQHP